MTSLGGLYMEGLISKFYGICSTCRAFSNNMELQIPKLKLRARNSLP